MGKVYQPIVINETETLLQGLIDSNFFKDYEIENILFAREYLLEIMNEKYISGLLGEENDELFNEEEFTKILQEIIAGTILSELKKNGYINSYEDDDTEEMFFLTEKGKEYLKSNKKKF
jgi:hypothetical protein